MSIDIWDFKLEGDALCIPTNLDVRKDGTAIMEAGLAKQAADRLPQAPIVLGEIIIHHHEQLIAAIGIWGQARTLAFPTKLHWHEIASLELIALSAAQLAVVGNRYQRIFIPKVDAGLSGLDFESQVLPILNVAFKQDPRFIFI